MIVAAEFSNRFQAEIALELLKSFGIESFIFADDCGGVAPGQSFVRGAKIYVHEEDAEAADEIIRGQNEDR